MTMAMIPVCRKCGNPKDYVIKSGKRAGKYHTYCRACLSAQVVAWQRSNPERSLERQRAYWRDNPDRKLRAQLRRYGVDEVWYKDKLDAQGGVCEICHRKEDTAQWARLSVDHNHETGKVRGLLCNTCNMRLAGLEAHEWLASAMAYLKKYQP